MPKNIAGGQSRGMRLGTRNTLVGLSFILPNFVGFLVFILIPIIFSLVLSFMKWDGFNEMTFVGLENFAKIFSEAKFRDALVRTLMYTAVCVVVTMFAALGLAVLMNKKLRGTGVFRSSIFFPYVASIVSVAVVWRLLFMKDFGPINAFLRFVGIENPPGWFGSTKWAIWGVILVSIWKFMGYYMIVYLAALQDVPTELREAAFIDGAGGLRYFWRIVMPSLIPSHFFVLLMLTINSFKSFDLVFALTEGGPGTSTQLVSNYIYYKAFTEYNYGHTSAAAMVLFLIIGAITLVQFRVEKKLSA